jgi:hypothetical protein
MLKYNWIARNQPIVKNHPASAFLISHLVYL